MKKLKVSWRILIATSTIGLVMLFVDSSATRISRHVDVGASGPSLFLPESVRELGQTSGQQEFRVPFQIGNLGRCRLVINEDDACRGCGDPIRQTIIVPPGESVEVMVKLDTRFRAGSIEKITSFTTSDPAHPRFDLTVRAWVNPDGSTHLSEAKRSQQVSLLIPQR